MYNFLSFTKTFLFVFFLIPIVGFSQINIVPQPVKVISLDGKLDIRKMESYYYSNAPTQDIMSDFLSWGKEYYALNLKRSAKPENAIRFVQTDTFSHKNAYLLTINEKGVEIRYKDEAGAFYATQTLKQLCPVEGSFSTENFKQALKVPYCQIYDYPRYAYRGMHLDECRHFFGMEAVKKYIDMLAFQKYNYFHWHLTDDQGWRIEIKRYPKLTQIASCRDETLIGHYRDKPVRYDGQKYCHYYTQEQIKEIVAYAAKKYITIVPEIEMPGHASAALSAYPELGCTGKPVKAATTWGVFEDIFCPKDGTFLFLQNVLDEVMMLFPSKYIHIGGDEVPKVQWKNCDFCQGLIKKYRLKNEEGLQSYFIQKIDKYVTSKGRTIIGWDEILEGGSAENAIVMSWRGTEGGIEAANQNHEVIMTPGAYCYFDHFQARRPGEPVAFGGLTTLKKVYSFDPTPQSLPLDKQKYILGGQANLWTEYIASPEHVQYMAYPRSFALSEVLWSPKDSKNYADFVRRLKVQLPRLDAWKINYAHHFYTLEIKSNHVNDRQKISFTTDAQPANILYRITEGKSTTAWLPYSEPIDMPNGMGVVEARMVDDEKKVDMPIYSKEYVSNIGCSAVMKLDAEPSEKYNLGGVVALQNGFYGTDDSFGGDEWLGFSGKDINANFQFNSKTALSQVEIRFYDDRGNWIYPPKSFTILGGDDNNNLTEIPCKVTINEMGNISKAFIQFKQPVDVSVLQVNIKRFGIIPDGEKGAGHEAWLFCDEILLR